MNRNLSWEGSMEDAALIEAIEAGEAADAHRVTQLFARQAELAGNLSLYVEMGDRPGWETARAELREVEDEIFVLTGKRPPYWTGWGILFASTGSVGEKED